ncbi:MAG: Na/Pi cotransporter family protein [Firmicutes bacterium]|nr:Na/Pi cotransporter family protein [Bacillota bacterium]
MTVYEFFTLMGGVGLFLYGMSIMSTGLRNAAGDQLRNILDKVTSNRYTAILIGLVVTLLIQSSSATDMMVISFVNSGLMSLAQAIGVIMGANIGTTITAQITAFNLTALAPLLIFIGCIMYLFVKKHSVKHIGSILLGFGMLFLGVGLMKSSIAPLADSPQFVRALSALDNPAAAVLFGIAFTALLQSSSSSIVIFQAFAVEGLLSYNQCVYLIIGAAIGSVTPNILASLTTDRDGKRTALLNLYFNLLRAALLIVVIAIFPGILSGIQALSPGNIARQVANTHTFFALFAVLVLSPFAGWIVKLSERTIPKHPDELRAAEEQRLIYLVNAERSIPSIAMRQAMLEVTRMGEMARENLDTALRYFFDPSQSDLFTQVETRETAIDYLNRAIGDKLVELRALPLSERDIFRLSRMILVVSNFERISDHAENIIEFGARLKNTGSSISTEGRTELRTMADTVLQTLDLSMKIFTTDDFSLLPQAEALEQQVDDMQETYMRNHIDRLMKSASNPVSAVVFTDMCTDLERCSDQAINIAAAFSDSPVDPDPILTEDAVPLA